MWDMKIMERHCFILRAIAPYRKVSYWKRQIYEEADEMEGWTFVGAKKTNRPLVEIYREAVIEIPQNMCVNTESYCFGPDAFSEWAKRH